MKRLLTIFYILLVLSVHAADDKTSNMAINSAPASGDLIFSVDISDVSQAASGTNKKLLLSGLGTFYESILSLQNFQGAITDAQVPDTITVNLATLASTITVVDSTSATTFVAIFDAATGSLAAKTDAALTYNATTGILTANGFAGAGGSLTLTATGFDGNLATTDDTLQEVAQKVDDLSGGGAPTTADYLVGTANGGLSAEIVVGTTPQGELGGTWASPTLDDSVTVVNWTLSTPSILGIVPWEDNVRQTFNPGGTVAGLNVGSQAGDPSTPINGDLWYDSTNNLLEARINGATVSLGAGGASGANPTASVGLTAVNGAAGTFLRSDGAPALSQSIVPTWTGLHTFTALVAVGNGATGPGAVRFLEDTDNAGGNYAELIAPANIASNYAVTLPNAASTLPIFGQQITVSGPTAARTWTAPDEAFTMMGLASTQAPTNKTFDAAATGNVLKFKSLPQFTSPLRVDGTNATIGTTVTAVGYGLATFSNSVDEATNWAEWRIVVPADWDTAVDPTIRIIDVIGADTGARQYVASVASVAASASSTTAPGTAIDVNMTADGSGASGDVEISSTTTLTGWGAAVTAGNMMIVRIARDGDQATQDASTVNSTLVAFELSYGATQ